MAARAPTKTESKLLEEIRQEEAAGLEEARKDALKTERAQETALKAEEAQETALKAEAAPDELNDNALNEKSGEGAKK
jgi:hypothetical protein